MQQWLFLAAHLCPFALAVIHCTKKHADKPFTSWLHPVLFPQGQHSANEYWSVHKYELNRKSMIDLKCGASSLKHRCSDGKGDFFVCDGKGSLSAVQFCIINTARYLDNQFWCDASRVPKQLFESDYETHTKALFLYLWLRHTSSPSSISCHFSCHAISSQSRIYWCVLQWKNLIRFRDKIGYLVLSQVPTLPLIKTQGTGDNNSYIVASGQKGNIIYSTHPRRSTLFGVSDSLLCQLDTGKFYNHILYGLQILANQRNVIKYIWEKFKNGEAVSSKK